MQRKEPTPWEDPWASSPSTSPHIGDYGGGTKNPKGHDYDVFLSFRGPDTRHGFTDHLYQRLVDAGIRVYIDIDELLVGDELGSQILDILTQSKISIPIISPNYVSSKWCLRELAHILKCKRSTGQIVLPVFYKVAPSDVRNLKGSFGKAFHSRRSQMDETEVKELIEALHEISSLKGWETEKFAYGNEGALIEVVVTKVVSLLKRTFGQIDTKELIGIDNHVEHIMAMIDLKSNDTRIIGIYGMGGSGKTTLAKVLCNNLSSHFKHLSFVANIREVSQRMGIEYLQEQLISDIRSMPCTVFDIYEGANIIKDEFTSKKVLLLLDDVDDDFPLDALIGDGSWFKAGSIIIITTRNMSILDEANADPKYPLNQLTLDQALTLFNRHSFGNDSPPEDYESISRAVVSGIVRIPRVLEAIGSSFRQKREQVWKDTLEKLKDDVLNNNVPELLHITYETLDYEHQQIFLDIACFFIGSSKQIPTYMWDACGFLPKEGIEASTS